MGRTLMAPLLVPQVSVLAMTQPGALTQLVADTGTARLWDEPPAAHEFVTGALGSLQSIAIIQPGANDMEFIAERGA